MVVEEEESRLQSHILHHPADAGQISREPHDGPANLFAEHYPNLNKPVSDTSAQNHPAVSKIRIEYEDGSHDEMELLDAAQGLYNWDRKRPTGKNTRGGLYTAHRIAAQLFKTGLEGCLAEDQSIFQKQASLLHAYIKD